MRLAVEPLVVERLVVELLVVERLDVRLVVELLPWPHFAAWAGFAFGMFWSAMFDPAAMVGYGC